MHKHKNILVTGASGFIGNRLVRELLSKNFHVIALYRSKKKFTGKTHKNLKLIQCDIENLNEKLKDQKLEIDTVCHLAAYIPKDFNDQTLAERCYQVNSLGTLKLLEYCYKHNVKHFVFFSSGNAYEYSELPVKESDKMYPSEKATYYLASKLIAEIYVEHFNKIGAMETTIFRLSSSYGPGMSKSEFIYKCINNLLHSKIVEIYNDDIYKTDFVYIDDIVEATVLCIQKSLYGIYNIGSGNSYTLGYVAKLIASLMNKPNSLISILPKRDFNIAYKGFSPLDMEKTKNTFGIVSTPLAGGLLKMKKALKLKSM